MNACFVQSIIISNIITYTQSSINFQNDSETIQKYKTFLKNQQKIDRYMFKETIKSKLILQTKTIVKIKTIYYNNNI